jgi:hypothetical protein
VKSIRLIVAVVFSILPALAQQEPQITPATSLPDLLPDAHGAISQEQMRKLFRIVAEKDIANDKRLRDYTYVERDEEHKLDGKGQLKSTEAKTYEVMEIYGEQVQRLIEKNDRALDPQAAAKEEEKLQKAVDKRKNESDDARRKREQKEEKDREEGRRFVLEVADAYNFHLVGTELLGNRQTWVIDADPRPDYEPHMKQAKFLPKLRGRVWIDKDDTQWAKLDIECIDTVSFGLFLARFHKGSRIMIEQTRVNNEVWLPKHVAVKLDVRVALLKDLNVEEDQTFRDYKKFRATTRIVDLNHLLPK